MNKVAVISSFVGALVLSASSFAASGVYLQGQAGVGGMDTEDNALANGLVSGSQNHDLKGLAGRISAGYLLSRGNLSYGAEAGWADYANNTYKFSDSGSLPPRDYRLRFEGYDVDLLAVLQYNMGSHWNLFSKAGLAYVDQKTDMSSGYAARIAGMGSATSVDTDKIEPEVIVGGGYDFNQHLGMNVSFDHIFGRKPDVNVDDHSISRGNFTNTAAVSSIMAGVTYRF